VEELLAGPGRTTAEPDELLESVAVPLPEPGCGSSYVRLEYRRQMEIAVVGATAVVRLLDGRVDHARIAITALAPTIRPELWWAFWALLSAVVAAMRLGGGSILTGGIDTFYAVIYWNQSRATRAGKPGPVDLLDFVDGTHATDTKHGDDFKFSIQDCSDWKRFKRHTICPYSLGTRYVASLLRWRQWRVLACPHLYDDGGDVVFAPMSIRHVD